MAKKILGRSLAYCKFLLRHEHELRTHWHAKAASIYAERWWRTIPEAQWPPTTAAYPGDNVWPFTRIRIAPAEYLAYRQSVEQTLTLSTLVTLVTAFETYFYDAVQRTVFLNPESLAKSTIEFAASELADKVGRSDFKAWFAHRIADRYCRNKSHAELIDRLAKMVKSGVANQMATDIDEWRRWVLTRNSIVHLGGEVSRQLADVWPERFPQASQPILLTGNEINRVGQLSRSIVEVLDERFVAEIVNDADQELMARELFVRHGISSPVAIAKHVNLMLGSRMSRNRAEAALARQRREALEETGFTFLDEMLNPHVA
jgi:hypothetical protein